MTFRGRLTFSRGVLFLTGCLLCSDSSAQTIPADDAASAFAFVRTVSASDAGQTWGMEVCGPMLFGDANTNDVIANEPDAQGQLKKDQ